MKSLILITFCFLLSIAANCQMDSTSRDLLETILRKQHPTDTLFYTDRLSNWTIKKMKELTRKRMYTGQSAYNKFDTVILSIREKKYLDSSINKFNSYYWPESLFKESKRIPEDSLWAHISKRRKESSLALKDTMATHLKSVIGSVVHSANTFQFSPPVYFRNKSFFFIYTLRLCGALCGTEDLAFYKLKDGKYYRWILFGGGEF